MENTLKRLGITDFKSGTVKSDIFSEGLSISSGSTRLVEFGLLKRNILNHFDIQQEVLYADFNWDLVLQSARNQKLKFTGIPKFPSVRRDFALLLDKSVSYEKIAALAGQTEKKLLKGVNLFDVYEGKNLPEGKKSYGVSFTFQDEFGTLTDKQVDKVMNKLRQRFEKDLEAELR